MTEQELTNVTNWVSKGAKLYIGRDHSGRQKIKVTRAWGLLVQRYQCSESDLAYLKQRIIKKPVVTQ